MLVGPHGSAAVAMYVEDHETAAATLAQKGFVLFSEADFSDEDGLT